MNSVDEKDGRFMTSSVDFRYSWSLNEDFCRYTPVERNIERARVIVVNSLLGTVDDLSALALEEWGDDAERKLSEENRIAEMACENIVKNVTRMVREPEIVTVKLSELTETAEKFRPDAIILSGTLSDFDYYNPEYLKSFADFIRNTRTPILGICGGHQLIGISFGARLVTVDGRRPESVRNNRVTEYEYRFVKITDDSDPIFSGLLDGGVSRWQEYTRRGELLRVWQNHGLQIDGVPAGFRTLATSFLCENQMMVRDEDGQLIYGVQFHLEKSFEDWNKNPSRWEHFNESRDGRILFENFLRVATRKIH